MVILGYRVAELARKTASESLEDNVLGLAAQTAYNFLFSLFPLFLFIAPMLSLFGDKEQIISVVSVVILAGGELNSELHHGTGSTASLKGSVYAGRIATGEQPSQPSSKIE